MSLTSAFRRVHFFENLQSSFEEYGYGFLPVLNQFRKTSEQGFQNISIYPTIYPEEIEFELCFGSRINIVEQTVQPYITGIPGFREEGNTAIISLSGFLQNPHFRLRAANEGEIEAVITYIKHFFRDGGFDYLESLTEIFELDGYFNDHPDEECPLSTNETLRCFRGITLATLTDNPRWDRINWRYIKKLKDITDSPVIRVHYKSMVSFLSHMGLN